MEQAGADKAFWIPISADNTLIMPDSRDWRPLSAQEYRFSGLQSQSEHYLGRWNGQPICLAEVAKDTPLPDNWRYLPMRAALPLLAPADFAAIGRALQILCWWKDHQWCGRCGARTEPMTDERACRCPACRCLWYPRITPCIIVLPLRGDELLLGHNAHFPRRIFSALAGFVEPGETLEHALVREVEEETGIRVANPRYFASQPWPFPSQLMLGFFADYESGEPMPDQEEILEVGWYHYRDLPPVPPAGISIAGDLISEAVRQLSGTQSG